MPEKKNPSNLYFLGLYENENLKNIHVSLLLQ